MSRPEDEKLDQDEISPATWKRLAALKVTTVGELQALEPAKLKEPMSVAEVKAFLEDKGITWPK